MKEILIQLMTAFLGALGFALLFGLHKRHLFFASLGGMITWGIYLLIHIFLQTPFLANLIASVFAVSFAEALAHWRKCPATLFVMPSIIPLVPGSSLHLPLPPESVLLQPAVSCMLPEDESSYRPADCLLFYRFLTNCGVKEV